MNVLGDLANPANATFVAVRAVCLGVKTHRHLRCFRLRSLLSIKGLAKLLKVSELAGSEIHAKVLASLALSRCCRSERREGVPSSNRPKGRCYKAIGPIP